jgi:starvation-inducible outer membrane lipoprotein
MTHKILILFLALTLSGCLVGPKVKKTQKETPATYSSGTFSSGPKSTRIRFSSR